MQGNITSIKQSIPHSTLAPKNGDGNDAKLEATKWQPTNWWVSSCWFTLWFSTSSRNMQVNQVLLSLRTDDEHNVILKEYFCVYFAGYYKVWGAVQDIIHSGLLRYTHSPFTHIHSPFTHIYSPFTYLYFHSLTHMHSTFTHIHSPLKHIHSPFTYTHIYIYIYTFFHVEKNQTVIINLYCNQQRSTIPSSPSLLHWLFLLSLSLVLLDSLFTKRRKVREKKKNFCILISVFELIILKNSKEHQISAISPPSWE